MTSPLNNAVTNMSTATVPAKRSCDDTAGAKTKKPRTRVPMKKPDVTNAQSLWCDEVWWKDNGGTGIQKEYQTEWKALPATEKAVSLLFVGINYTNVFLGFPEEVQLSQVAPLHDPIPASRQLNFLTIRALYSMPPARRLRRPARLPNFLPIPA
ncbi:hypothetical protein CONPUDRAFT_135901 [Coniophora puteana RWD-64-598 SS2]|uniref:Uncharacterized protein n=1 Tax=Coniophora puteana (strain RWD-64-598) TaxID=741705 RepID=A0A5M3MZG9_CONPW|nr:uncharacterized protein CONPUDRAFT_135901 [Coniophora puteana RWD-64-598 SS2]EIW84529.1 hypothetical protein CONPUDRAFT_135901 [Coniophora puteana RWD-64-598 SS2]